MPARDEFREGGYSEPSGSRGQFWRVIALAVSWTRNGKLPYAGRVGTSSMHRLDAMSKSNSILESIKCRSPARRRA